MKEKQRRFCEEYLVDLNGQAAAVRAGYMPKYAKDRASRLLQEKEVQEYLRKRMQEKDNELIAQQDEVLKYLTSVMRGNEKDQVVTMKGFVVEVTSSTKDRVKAAELIGKRYGLFTERMDVATDMTLNITVDYGPDTPGE